MTLLLSLYFAFYRIIRYEDLSFNAYNMTRELFDFFHLTYHSSVQKFLDTHTKTSIGGVSSTFRDSKTAPIHWQKDLPWQEVNSIQEVCRKALKLWGYVLAKNETHLRSFMPVGEFNNDWLISLYGCENLERITRVFKKNSDLRWYRNKTYV